MTHTAMIGLWPSLTDFAADIGVSYGTAKAMRRRGSIPAEYWKAVVEGARRRDLDVTFEALAEAVASEVTA